MFDSEAEQWNLHFAQLTPRARTEARLQGYLAAVPSTPLYPFVEC